MATTEESRDLEIMQHALGLDQYGRGREYRNRFVTGGAGPDHERCNRLAEQGLMVKVPAPPFLLDGTLFHVTDEGRAYVREHSPVPPKRTRGQKRYDAYLEADNGQSFGDWLRNGGGR